MVRREGALYLQGGLRCIQVCDASSEKVDSEQSIQDAVDTVRAGGCAAQLSCVILEGLQQTHRPLNSALHHLNTSALLQTPKGADQHVHTSTQKLLGVPDPQWQETYLEIKCMHPQSASGSDRLAAGQPC